MRYSPYDTVKPQQLEVNSNEQFFQNVQRSVGTSALHGAILLVGANDHRALAVRHAQGALRFDRRPSRWSHAALIVHWDEALSKVSGVEVALDPTDHTKQVPELNGVTQFALSKYFEQRRYPNVALIVVAFEPPEPVSEGEATAASAAQRRLMALQAALEPIRERERYPFWDLLAVWARYAYAPYTTTNPLLEGIPLPSAALCEYAYEAAALDLTPGATGNNNCPEVLYATAKHWSGGLQETQGATMKLFSLVRNEHQIPQPELRSIGDVSAPSLEELKT